MLFLAYAQGADEPIHATVESLQRIYTIILALSIAEAFKQCVVDRSEPTSRKLYWDRLLALACFLALVVPFYHGMTRYLFDVYLAPPRPSAYGLPYGFWLSLDCLVFTIEAGLFFLLSRSLSRNHWRWFYCTVLVLLMLDVGWGLIVCGGHNSIPKVWVYVNAIHFVPLLLVLIFCWRGKSWVGPIVAAGVVFARTASDYAYGWDFYFPPG